MSMTDRNTGGNNLTNKLLQAIYCLTATTTYTPGAGGGSAFTITPPFKLRFLTSANPPSLTAANTEATGTNNPGYTAGGISMGSPAFGTPSGGVITSSNAISYTASGTQTANLNGAEVWDSASTALRYMAGALSAAVSGVVSGDTVQAAAGAISADASQW